MKVYFIIFLMLTICMNSYSQNLLKKINFSKLKVTKKGVYSKSIIAALGGKKAAFTWRDNEILMLGNGSVKYTIHDSIQIIYNDLDRGKISWKLNQSLIKDSLYSLSFEMYSTTEELSFLDRFRLVKMGNIAGIDLCMVYAKPGVERNGIVPKINWTKHTIIYVGTSNEESIDFAFSMVDDKYSNDAIYIRNVSLTRYSQVDEDNLVPNGDFEIFHQLPNRPFFGTGTLCYWQKINLDEFKCIDSRDTNHGVNVMSQDGLVAFNVINNGTPDHGATSVFLDIEDTTITAFNGNCFGRIGVDEKGVTKTNNISSGEYLQVRLISPLIRENKYLISLMVMHDPRSQILSNGIGVKFTSCPFNPFDSLHVNGKVLPQCDYMLDAEPISDDDWQEYTFEYLSDGGEEFITIGLFSNDMKNKYLNVKESKGKLKKAFYLLDAISVVKLE